MHASWASTGARVVGVDLSAAVEKAATLCADFPDVAIVQADLLDLPLADASFDAAFSIGVMHHSPDPRKAFAQVARKVKPGGRMAVWLYRKNVAPQEWINSGLRAITTRMPPRLLEQLCAAAGVLGGMPVLNKTLNKVANFSNHPDWTLRVCDNFDWYAPKYQSHHTVAELSRWLVEEGFDDLTELRPALGPRVRLGVSARPDHRQRRERGGDEAGVRDGSSCYEAAASPGDSVDLGVTGAGVTNFAIIGTIASIISAATGAAAYGRDGPSATQRPRITGGQRTRAGRTPR